MTWTSFFIGLQVVLDIYFIYNFKLLWETLVRISNMLSDYVKTLEDKD